jgi:streptogramin lyase
MSNSGFLCSLPGRRFAGRLSAVAAAIALALPVQGIAASKTYTFDADFALGVLDSVNYTTIHNQLQLNAIGSAFPVLWIANAGEDTVSKIDTVTNKEIARYRTWFGPAGQPGYVNHLNSAYSSAAPSRTAVDINGNAYVANRHFDGLQADVLKILNDGGIDRNGNGVIDTSSDTSGNGIIEPGEMKNLADTNGNSAIDPGEIQDERVAWAVKVGTPGALGRSLCIGTDGNLWVGQYNTGRYYKISSADGSVLAGPVSIGTTPYGCLVDRNGILWSASLASQLGRLDTNTLATAVFTHPGSDYGIALGNNMVYQANYGGLTYTQFDPATNSFTTPAALRYSALGIATDGSGNILVGNWQGGGVTKFTPAGAVTWSAPRQAGTGEVRGVQVDGNNDVWLIHLDTHNISKHRGTDGGPLGVFPIGNSPYTYSDASGFAARNITNATGTWTVITDGNANGTNWGTVNWTENLPTGTSIEVKVRAADLQANLPLQAYQAVGNGASFSKSGRFIQVQARLNANTTNQSPVLFDLTVASNASGACDVDVDGDVDSIDIALIRAAIGQTPTLNDPRDANGDGKITINDARYCALRCTRTSCATN